MPKPIKRHISLQALSREHHSGLLLSWKIRQGFTFGVTPVRIKKYTDWFWRYHLKAHFEFEEKYIFPILDKDHQLIQRALREHKELKRLFTAVNQAESNLTLIKDKIVEHIRFEERILFQEIEAEATTEELKRIEKEHSKPITKEWNDEFWIRGKKGE